MAADTKKCSAKDRAGRLAKARQFIDAAALIDDFTTDGQDLVTSMALLAQIDKSLAKDLQRLLGLKTKAGYSSAPSSAADRRTAGRTAARLVDAASGI
jgi:hypothetical protein